MKRRIKTKVKTKKTKRREASGKLGFKENVRFGLSMTILTSLLLMSFFLFLASADSLWLNKDDNVTVLAVGAAGEPSGLQKRIFSDPEVDFKVSIPSIWDGWVYKMGYVQSPIDETLSDQYVQFFLPVAGKANSNNFEEKQKNILTIRKFSQEEWEELKEGCQKGNLYYCDAAGTKLADGEGYVFSYVKVKGDDCPGQMKSKCERIDKVVESFELKQKL